MHFAYFESRRFSQKTMINVCTYEKRIRSIWRVLILFVLRNCTFRSTKCLQKTFWISKWNAYNNNYYFTLTNIIYITNQMNLFRKLQFASSYNWWTNEKQKTNSKLHITNYFRTNLLTSIKKHKNIIYTTRWKWKWKWKRNCCCCWYWYCF